MNEADIFSGSWKMKAPFFCRLLLVVLYSSFVLGEPRFLKNTAVSSDSWAIRTLRQLTVRQKIGQLFTFTPGTEDVLTAGHSMNVSAVSPSEIACLIKEYGIGGVLFIRRSNIAEHIDLINAWQGMSEIPLLVCEDCEWGLAMRLNDGIKYPRNMTLGAIQNEELIYQVGYEIGRQCRSVGIYMNLAPVIDVNNNPLNPVISDRSFGESPERVARLGALFNQGMQDAGILTCIKHFPGHGDTATDSHLALPRIEKSREELDCVELVPFKRLIDAGADAVMGAHMYVPALDQKNISTFSYPLLTEILQKQLGFEGIILTDALCMGALKEFAPGDVELKAFLAGNDLFLCSRNIPLAIQRLEEAIKSGLIPEEELDRRVLKILLAKEYLGLHKNRFVNLFEASTSVDTYDARALKKQLYQSAITVVKNEENVIPLTSQDHVAIIQIGRTGERVFGKILCERCMGTSFALAGGITDGDAENFLAENSLLFQNVSKIVVCITGMVKLASKNFGITPGIKYLIDGIMAFRRPTILVLCGSPYSLGLFGAQDALVVAYEDDFDALEASAHVLDGTFSPTGILPISAGSFSAGIGL